MAINYPTSLDTFTNPGTGDPLNSPSHAGQHANANDAAEALEAKVGITASTPTVDKLFVGTDTGKSEWKAYGATNLWLFNQVFS